MLVAEITRDSIWQPNDDLPSRAGREFVMHDQAAHDLGLDGQTEKTKFRCKDDDGEIYYSGWLLNDSQGEVQSEVLRWCERDAGCTEIQVKIEDEWRTEIG